MHRIPQKLSLVSQTAAILTERIQAGEWHRWLPGEHELCGQLHIARMTLRRALQQLQRNGLIRSSQGKPREIVARRAKTAPSISGRVLLLTQVPMKTRLPFDAFWLHELREALKYLRGPLGNKRAFRIMIERIVADANTRERLFKELGIS